MLLIFKNKLTRQKFFAKNIITTNFLIYYEDKI